MRSRDLHSEPSPVESMRIETAPLFLRLATGLLLALAAAACSAEKGTLLPAPVDLARDGAEAAARRQPVVILFSLPGCHYCDVVRQHYLVPLVRDLPEQDRPVIREVRINGRASFTGFDGVRITHSGFAARYDARFAPTVVFLDRTGRPLAQPIIGGDTAGLYGGYLDNAFAEASKKLTGSQRPHTSGD
ncbi:MAG TPA: thioredoxin fold domain-containing protein [Noviherbaspirillum sp.]|nr:thioredoxin fold domain-containing protein [Noviherbaspirillum sp.]